MVVELCGESISIPNGIADWVRQSDDNRTEFDGMVESMIWAIKKYYKKDAEKSEDNGESPITEFMTAYKDLLSTLLGKGSD